MRVVVLVIGGGSLFIFLDDYDYLEFEEEDEVFEYYNLGDEELDLERVVR